MDYFPFGRPGSGAPVRDEYSNVVTNVTFSRSKRIVPLCARQPPFPIRTAYSQASGRGWAIHFDATVGNLSVFS